MADKQARPRRRNGFGSWLIAVICIAIVGGLFVLRETVARPYRIPSESMAPTLVAGDVIIAARVARERGAPVVRAGDVVIHTGAEGRDFVRRVIALPGQRVAFEDGFPIIDGVAAEREVIEDVGGAERTYRIYRERMSGRAYRVQLALGRDGDVRDMAEIEVPAGQVFVVGDSRDNSFDSRSVGPVPIMDIHHRATFIVWSSDSNRIGDAIE